MELKSQILNYTSLKNIYLVIDLIGDDKNKFKELMSYVFGKEEKLAKNSAWIAKHICEQKPNWLLPYEEKLFSILKNVKSNQVLRRNILGIFQHTGINETICSELFDYSLAVALSPDEKPASRHYAINVALKIVMQYPELKEEFKKILLLIKERNEEIPSLKVSLRNSLKALTL